MTTHTPPVRTLDSAWHPFEVLFMGFGLAVGFPLLWGAPAPASTAALLSPWAQHVWGWLLVGGCATTLAGALWQRRAELGRGWGRIRPTSGGGLGIEQVGLAAVGIGTAIFVVGIVLAHASPGRFVAAGLVAGMGAACAVRFLQIQRWTKATIHDREVL